MKESESAGLESQEHRDLLDIVDKLRSGGVSRYIDLPQIVVCGDQSSGKSSVLEAISGMAFPAKDNLCTHFAIEVILRRDPSSTVSVSITPAAHRPQAEQQKLLAFSSTGSENNLDLGLAFEEARALIGVGEKSAFSFDVLRIKLAGPLQPNLTVVDLPHLLQAGNREEKAKDADFVRDLALSYMKRQRTIIVAVISAKSDVMVQEVTRLARILDPKGLRTLGVITKPDTIDKGSVDEKAFVKLVQRNGTRLGLGWHILCNGDFDARTTTMEDRGRTEMQFFSQGVWTSISQYHLGAASLRKRLMSILQGQILSQLPELVTDLKKKVQQCRFELEKIGPSRATTQEQRQYLIQASHHFCKIIQSSIDGNYADPVFGTLEEGSENRLRAVVQNSLLDLVTVMDSKGRSRKIVETEVVGPGEVSRDNFLVEVKKVISMNRGRELPGTYNPAVIGQLFRTQSKPWKGLFHRRATSILTNARDAVRGILEHILDDDVMERVFGWIVNPALDEIWQSMKRKLEEIMTVHVTLHPITYNRSLVGLVRERRLAQEKKDFEKIISASVYQGRVKEDLLASLLEKAKLDLDRDAGSDALDWMEAYYDISLARTLDDFGIFVVESCLIQKLPGLFSPEAVYLMDDRTIRRIASENEASAAESSRLTDMLDTLEKGLGELTSRTGFQTGIHSKQPILYHQPNGVAEMDPEPPTDIIPAKLEPIPEDKVVDVDYMITPISISEKNASSWGAFGLEVEVEPQPVQEETPAVHDALFASKKVKKKKKASIWDDFDPPPVEPVEEDPPKVDDEWGIPTISKKDKFKKSKKKKASMWFDPEPEPVPET